MVETVETEDRKSQAKWYILHTYSGYEAMVKSSLEKLIENNNLKDHIFDLKIPTEQTVEEKNGKRKLVEHKLLPCYVFIKMIYSNQLWYLITNTRGVTGFVGPQGRPIPMKEEEIKKMKLEEFVINVDFKVGERVMVTEGLAKDLVGEVLALDDENQQVKIRTTIANSVQDVVVRYSEVEKVEELAE